MDLKHFSHNHGLVYHQTHQGSEIHCSGCKSQASGEIYACWQCNYFLHGQCFRATRSLKHPSHPLHPLTLVPFPTYPSGSFICNTCNLAGDGFSYSCSACEFDIHVGCAHLPNDSYPHIPPSPIPNPNFNNPIYPPPIQTSPYPTYPPPNPTNIPNDIHFNYPPPHQPPITSYPNLPNNPSPNFLNETQNYTNPHQTLDHTHQNTAYPYPQPDPTPQKYTPQSNNPPLTNPPLPPQPNATGPTYSTVVTPTPPPKPPTIKHFSHPHALKSTELDPKNAKTCSACERELSGSAYCCTEPHCTFNLHKKCFDSPREVRHKSHLEHALTLLTAPPYSEGFTCNACLKDGKAFAYTCAECSYDLHVQCVRWPDSVTRGDHKHALTLYYSSPAAETNGGAAEFMCDVCRSPVHEMAWVYYCRECDFGTHLECVASAIRPESNGGGNVGGGGGKRDEELIRETELKLAMLQILLEAQGRKAALDLV